MQIEDRNGAKEVYKAGKKLDGGFKVTEKTAVLIDGNSASASEITAAALHQNSQIPLVGEKSFGKGTVSKCRRDEQQQRTQADRCQMVNARWHLDQPQRPNA